MSRARATALALVNWRGVFYERYLLDSHVTALEGTNGAGKTTVLIGCYVVLLPDMTRLRFTNLGEHSSSGGDRGLWGRLGESSRPAYSVLELTLNHGERLLAGVHLQRKAEPTVELTPFIITGLNDSARLQDLLLDRGEMDGIPELTQLRDQVARHGAVMQVYSTAKEYFAALFERGITPLRLASDNDRNKLNEMLRTSMTGGISRALTSELRDFLLKEEAGLADTLKRMRANLDACRRTRIEVEESRKLEEEIAGVYEAGQQMFAAAMHATHERADEMRRRFEEASRTAEQAEDAEQKLGVELEDSKAESDRLGQELNTSERQVVDARELLDRLTRARSIAKQIVTNKAELHTKRQVHEEARSNRQEAEKRRSRARTERDNAQRDYENATLSFADLQQGLEEIQRRASEHSLATRHLNRAQVLLPGKQIDGDTVGQVLSDSESRYEQKLKEFRHLSNRIRNDEQHRNEFEHVYQALVAISAEKGEEIALPDAFRTAQAVSNELRALEATAERREALTRSIRDTSKLAESQTRARESASALSTAEAAIDSAATVREALNQTDAKIESSEERLLELRQKAEATKNNLSGLSEQKTNLERAIAAWHDMLGRLEPLEQQLGHSLRSREELQTVRVRLDEARDNYRDQLGQLRLVQQRLMDEASQLEQSGGTFPASLLHARDLVDGELLATQFEELTIEQAGEVEALLGPLAHAIVVDDPATAATALCEVGDVPDSVWLVGGDLAPVVDLQGRPEGKVVGRHAVVETATSRRVSRVPKHPTLGRRARARRVQEIREEAASQAARIEQLESELRRTVRQLGEIARLFSEADALEKGDPSCELARVEKMIQAALQAEQEHREAAMQLSSVVDAMRSHRKALQDLLANAWLLDEPDQQHRLLELNRALEEAKRAAQRLCDVADKRETLESQMDVLRVPPPTQDELVALKAHLADLEQERDILLDAVQAMRYVDEHRAALAWSDAPEALKREVALVPAIQRQLEQAGAASKAAEDAVDLADDVLDKAIQRFNHIDADVQLLAKDLERDEERWRECGVESASDEDVQLAEQVVTEAEAASHDLKSKVKAIDEKINRLDERRKLAAEHTGRCRDERDEAERGWRPNQERWDKLEVLATEHGVLASAMTRRFIDMFAGRGSANVRSDAKEAAARLKERLSHARDSTDVSQAVAELLGTQELSGEACLQAWLSVRGWLRRRIPTQIAEVAEPVEALERLRSHLNGLEDRLGRQEADLRGESSDVAKNIDIHIRRAQRQVNKLNQDLVDVRFGSIRGVRLRLERVERMEQILNALRDGEAQALLFQPGMPIETALDELFRRYGGGGKTTGQRLLDYREYVEPKVEVRRQSNEHWEVANPTRMSTGEAIGVGAALMMVVLTAWERDANLLRPKRSHGTLRLLFLDEANRLSQDNLIVLFDLCQSLDLQLIIAAPEVAQAQGNTTYRLVRRLTESGDEEVVVTGRRLATERHV